MKVYYSKNSIVYHSASILANYLTNKAQITFKTSLTQFTPQNVYFHTFKSGWNTEMYSIHSKQNNQEYPIGLGMSIPKGDIKYDPEHYISVRYVSEFLRSCKVSWYNQS